MKNFTKRSAKRNKQSKQNSPRSVVTEPMVECWEHTFNRRQDSVCSLDGAKNANKISICIVDGHKKQLLARLDFECFVAFRAQLWSPVENDWSVFHDFLVLSQCLFALVPRTDPPSALTQKTPRERSLLWFVGNPLTITTVAIFGVGFLFAVTILDVSV